MAFAKDETEDHENRVVLGWRWDRSTTRWATGGMDSANVAVTGVER